MRTGSRSMLVPRLGAAACLAAAFLGVARTAWADVTFGPNDVPTMFFIDKSDDRNRVDYGIRLDASCLPVGSSPVEVYWREFEGGRGGRVTHGLNLLEGPAYGVGALRVTETRADGASLEIEVRALPSRRILVRTSRLDGRCVAVASTRIAGVMARLERVYLTLGDTPGTLRYADLYGTAEAGGAAVSERLVR